MSPPGGFGAASVTARINLPVAKEHIRFVIYLVQEKYHLSTDIMGMHVQSYVWKRGLHCA